MGDGLEKESWFSQNKIWFIPVVILVLVLSCLSSIALSITGIFGTLKASDVYQLALEETQASPKSIAALGEPIKPGFWVSGSINISGPSGSADLAIPVSGPKGSGTLYVVANKSAGLWNFTTLQLLPKDGGSRLNLLEER